MFTPSERGGGGGGGGGKAGGGYPKRTLRKYQSLPPIKGEKKLALSPV